MMWAPVKWATALLLFGLTWSDVAFASTPCLRRGCANAERDRNGCCPLPKCPHGQSVRQGTNFTCCWGGQTWSGNLGRCAGSPVCPQGYTRTGDTCLPPPATDVAGFGLFQTEITVGQYRACVDAGACTPPDATADCNWPFTERASHPVNCVDFTQATAYCAWVDARLPTDYEWLDAATWGGASITPWGGGDLSCERATLGSKGKACAGRSTAPACARPLGNSPVGHCDLFGNVWEWTTSAPESRPTWRVIEGGGWLTSPMALEKDHCGADSPTVRSAGTGFRCFRDPPHGAATPAVTEQAPAPKSDTP
jgi:hypothetical protein